MYIFILLYFDDFDAFYKQQMLNHDFYFFCRCGPPSLTTFWQLPHSPTPQNPKTASLWFMHKPYYFPHTETEKQQQTFAVFFFATFLRSPPPSHMHSLHERLRGQTKKEKRNAELGIGIWSPLSRGPCQCEASAPASMMRQMLHATFVSSCLQPDIEKA